MACKSFAFPLALLPAPRSDCSWFKTPSYTDSIPGIRAAAKTKPPNFLSARVVTTRAGGQNSRRKTPAVFNLRSENGLLSGFLIVAFATACAATFRDILRTSATFVAESVSFVSISADLAKSTASFSFPMISLARLNTSPVPDAIARSLSNALMITNLSA